MVMVMMMMMMVTRSPFKFPYLAVVAAPSPSPVIFHRRRRNGTEGGSYRRGGLPRRRDRDLVRTLVNPDLRPRQYPPLVLTNAR